MKPTLTLIFLLLSLALRSAEPLPEMKLLLGEHGYVIFSESFDGPNPAPLRVIRNTKSEIAKGGVSLVTKINAFQ